MESTYVADRARTDERIGPRNVERQLGLVLVKDATFDVSDWRQASTESDERAENLLSSAQVMSDLW